MHQRKRRRRRCRASSLSPSLPPPPPPPLINLTSPSSSPSISIVSKRFWLSLSLSLSLCFCFLVWVNFDAKTCRSRSFFESMRSGSGGKCKRWLLEATEHSLPHPVHCLLLENKFLLSITILNLWYSFFFFIFLF